ncbi:unnamed protein product [Phyllotreta striolata]|uniref:Uncharacterized protein n=1 Tax=Phyllotreta striolata TaxID=444603 RepID=A0A9N9TWE6_PHYSR|nr:unnamed protein product [Phyllotreta striolata]
MTLATCAKDVRFYKWPNISYFGEYETPADCMGVKSISWSSNSKELVVVKSKGCPVILNVPAKADQYVESTECNYIAYASVATFSNTNPDLVAFGTEDGCLLVYDTKRAGRPQDCIKLPSPVQNVEFSSDDQCFVTGCSSGQIFLFDCNRKPCASFLVSKSPTLSALAYSKVTPHLLAAASKDGVLSVWNTDTTDNLLSNRKHTARITDIAFYQSSLTSIGIDGKFVNYDLRCCKPACSYDLECSLSSLAYLEGSNELAISTMSGQLRSYDIRNMETPLRTLVALSNGGFKKISFPFNDDGYCPSSKRFGDGDCSVASGSSPGRSNLSRLASDNDTVPQEIEAAKRPDKEDVGKFVEEEMKIATRDFEEKLLQRFYALRINSSKQFIGLEEKISSSWNAFVDYLRVSGQATNRPSYVGVGVQKSRNTLEHDATH